jgi:cyanate lyase
MAKRVPPASTDSPPKKRAPRQVPVDDVPPDDLQALFGRSLKIARLQMRLTLEDITLATGMKNQYVSKVENGQTNLTLATMKKLAAVVRLDVSEMIKRPSLRTNPVIRTPRNKP